MLRIVDAFRGYFADWVSFLFWIVGTKRIDRMRPSNVIPNWSQ